MIKKVRNTSFYFFFKINLKKDNLEKIIYDNLNEINDSEIKQINVTYTILNNEYHIVIWISHYKKIKIKKNNIKEWFNIEDLEFNIFHNKRYTINDIV